MNLLLRHSTLVMTLLGATLSVAAGNASAATEAGLSRDLRRAGVEEAPSSRVLVRPGAPTLGTPTLGTPAVVRMQNVSPPPEAIAYKKPSGLKFLRRGGKGVPEFDGKSGGAAAALVLGSVLVMVERRRRSA